MWEGATYGGIKKKIHVDRSKVLIDRCRTLVEEILSGCSFADEVKGDPDKYRRFRMCLSGICAYYVGAVFHSKTAKEIINRCAERAADGPEEVLRTIKGDYEKAGEIVEGLENRGLGTAVIAHKDQLLETVGIDTGESDHILIIKLIINFYVDLVKKAEKNG